MSEGVDGQKPLSRCFIPCESRGETREAGAGGSCGVWDGGSGLGCGCLLIAHVRDLS